MKKVNNERIRSIRMELRMTQGEFARRIGVSPVMIERWEYDKVKPSDLAMQRIENLAKGAGITQRKSPSEF